MEKKKLAKSDFTKTICKAKEYNFLTSNIKQAFTQLRQIFIKVLIF